MERTLFSDLVVSRGAARARAGGMPVSMAVHAVAFAAVIGLAAVVPEPLPVPPPPRIDDVLLPTIPRPPAVTTTAAAAPRRERSAPPRTAVQVVDIDTPPVAATEPDSLPLDDRGGFCIGCAPTVGQTDGTGDPTAVIGTGDGHGPAVPSEPVRPGGLIQAPRKIRHVDPEYPELARKAGVAGVVVLDCVIDREGAVRSVQLVSGHPLLNEAAMSAVRRWAYRPTLLNGVPIEVVMTVTVRFTATRPR